MSLATDNSPLRERAQKALAAFLQRKHQPPAWEGRKIVVYGAGKFGRDLAGALLRQPKAEVLGFLDQKGAGQVVVGDLRAHSFASDQARQWLAEKPVVVIGIYNHFSPLREITARLAEFGFSNIVTPMEAYPHVSQELGWRYALGTPDDYAAAAAPIEQVRALWADPDSERLFLENLLFRLAFDVEMLAHPTGDAVQYADPTLPRWSEPLRMVDGGAYTGDSLQGLQRHGYKFAAVHAFEPDEENFKKLCLNAPAAAPGAALSLWPCGLWSSTRRLNFAEGGGAGSSFSATGPSSVPVVALDEVLHGQPINLIKLDIEGAEPDALLGARRLIEKNRPGLAVCLYHWPQQLWTIPLWVQSLDLGYRLHCRVHNQSNFDTVLYAIPK